jgi:hypothetical protein
MLINRVETTVGADHSQYTVQDDEYADRNEPDTGGTGLIGPQGEVAFVVTGTNYGPVRLTLEAHDGPPALDLEAWDEVVDVTMDLPSGTLVVLTLMGSPAGDIDVSAGPCWLRMQARGRDAAWEDPTYDDGKPVEEHLIAVWPADAAAEAPRAVVHKATDSIGAYFRNAEAPPDPSTVEFRTSPAVWSIRDRERWPEESGVEVRFDQAVAATEALDITLTTVTVHRTGCAFLLEVQARRGGTDRADWDRFSDIVRSGFGFPGHPLRRPLHPDALRMSLAWPGQEAVTSAKRQDATASPAGQPTLVGYGHSAMPLGDRVRAEHVAWLCPRPPAQPLELTLWWPGVGLPPTTVTVDGGRLAVAD